MPKTVNIVFPTEIINRELDFRLVLAVLTARPGIRIWVGEQKTIARLSEMLPQTIHAGQNFANDFSQSARYKHFKKRGSVLFQLLEEGGVLNGGPETWKKILLRRLDPRGLEADDTVCAWGDWQRDYFQSLGTAATVRTTGHPRFDLLKPKFRPYFQETVDQLRERWGNFILINTNITRSNNVEGLKYWFGDRRFYQAEDYEARTALIDHWAHQASIQGHFVRLLNRLAHEFPETPFILRAHPVENLADYHLIFRDIANVHIVREGGVGAWLLAARAVIHDGCTTGLETHLADTPLINFKAIEDERYDLFLPNAFGIRAQTQDEVIIAVEQAINGELKNPPAHSLPPLTGALLHNLEHDSMEPFAEMIAERAAQMEPQNFEPQPWLRKEALRTMRYKLRGKGFDGKWNPLSGENIESKMEAAMRTVNKRVRWTLWNDAMISVDAD